MRQNQTATEGKSVSLDCSAAGYPKPEYQWMFENKTVSSLSILTISNVSGRNEGVYLCLARNNLGEVMLLVHLDVLGRCFRILKREIFSIFAFANSWTERGIFLKGDVFPYFSQFTLTSSALSIIDIT